jgi:hypothetical protein
MSFTKNVSSFHNESKAHQIIQLESSRSWNYKCDGNLKFKALDKEW